MTIDELIEEGHRVMATVKQDSMGLTEYVDNGIYEPWKRKALMFVQYAYPNNPQIKTMEAHVSQDNFSYHCMSILSILEAFKAIDPKEIKVDYQGILDTIFNNFATFARQLLRRHAGRETIKITDEYDVQDLLNALFCLHFKDVRPEEWTPSYAGGTNRMDFLLKDEEIAIEVKMTRAGLKEKELGEQLIIDIAKYKQHPNCKCLYCFVYDPDYIIRNPRGVEKDLEALEKDFKVRVYIRPVL